MANTGVKEVRLKKEGSGSMNLSSTRFITTHSSGAVYAWGRRTDDDPWAFFGYDLRADNDLTMVEYKCPGYQHGPFVDLLSATGNFAGEQVLAACSESREIKMLLTASGYINVAYQNSDDDVTLRFICEGEQGNLFAYSSEDPGVIVGLSTTLPFKVLSDDMYFPGQEVKEGIFYLGKPQEALISLGEKIMARDLKGKDLWAVEGEVEGKTINPKGIAFSRQHQVLLVADGTNGRLLVLHPETGEVLQTVPLPEDLGVIYSVRVRKSDDGDDLVVYSKGSDNTLSWFSFQ